MSHNAAAIERANSYRDMMKMWAWKDLQNFLDDARITALNHAVASDEIKDIQVQRGIVRAIDAIYSHIGFVTGPLE